MKLRYLLNFILFSLIALTIAIPGYPYWSADKQMNLFVYAVISFGLLSVYNLIRFFFSKGSLSSDVKGRIRLFQSPMVCLFVSVALFNGSFLLLAVAIANHLQGHPKYTEYVWYAVALGTSIVLYRRFRKLGGSVSDAMSRIMNVINGRRRDHSSEDNGV
ncbi:MAG: hypothetical protein ACYTEX_15920 [Planctomycetota bacterium]|jgi:hypothetical protein